MKQESQRRVVVREQAYQNGHKDGYKEGESRLAQLLQILTNTGRSDDINRITTDQTYREQLYMENNL